MSIHPDLPDVLCIHVVLEHDDVIRTKGVGAWGGDYVAVVVDWTLLQRHPH
jgi:hypothetical protein